MTILSHSIFIALLVIQVARGLLFQQKCYPVFTLVTLTEEIETKTNPKSLSASGSPILFCLIYLFIYLSIYLFVYLSIYLFIVLLIC